MNIFTTKIKFLLCSMLLSCMSIIYAQNPTFNCATNTSQESLDYIKSIKPQLKIHEEDFMKLKSSKGEISANYTNFIPIKAHVIRQSDGSGGISSSELNDVIDDLNEKFSEAFLEFFYCDGINYIDNDTFCNFNKGDENDFVEDNNVSGLINIYFTSHLENDYNESICGYSDNTSRNDVIVIKNDCATNGSSLTHEMGHFFSLIHTHGTHNDELTTELVDGSNCDTDGDGICDTPADPKLTSKNINNSCEYTGDDTDANGDKFSPDTGNIMSYSKKQCRSHFSQQQLARMYAFYMTTKNYLSCSSFNADFTADISQTCDETLTVNLESSCTNANLWEWDIDSDGIIDYTSKNITHTFDSGIFDVTLKISNKSKTINKTYSKFIKVGMPVTLLDENFNSFEMIGDGGWTANDVSKSGYNWYTNSGDTSSEETGPINDNTNGELLGKYIYAEASDANPGDVAEFISPCINVEYANSEIEFAYHMFGEHIGELHVDIKTENGYINDVIPALYGNQQLSQDEAFLTKTINLASYVNQTIKVRFRAIRGNGWKGDIAIDDVYIKTIHTAITDENFKVYPNPIKNNFLFVKTNNFEDDSDAIINYRVTNLVGQTFLSGVMDNQPINVSNIPSGTYLLILSDNNSKVVKKIIK